MKKKFWILVLILIVIGLVWYFLANKKVVAPTPDKVASSSVLAEETSPTSTIPEIPPKIPEGDRVPSRYACVGEYCDGSMYGDDYKEVFSILKIPFVADGGNIGCGVKIFYGYDTATKTPAIMDATYKRLFDIKQWPEIKEDGFRNTVAAFTKTYFDKVTLSDGLARVYLTGYMMSPGTCADPEFKAQIEAAAFQFENVKKLEVYLNGKIFDWCTLDMSDGEGYCAQGPQYWITNK